MRKEKAFSEKGGTVWRFLPRFDGSLLLKIHRGDQMVPAGARVVKVSHDTGRTGQALPWGLAAEEIARAMITRAKSRTPKRILKSRGPQIMALCYIDGVPARRTRGGHFVEAEEGRNLAFFGLEELVRILTGSDAMTGARVLGEALRKVAEEEGLL